MCQKSLSLSFLLCTMGVASPPPRAGVRTRGRGTGDVPRKVPVRPGLGGQDLATLIPSPSLSWPLWDQGWLSGSNSTLGHRVWGLNTGVGTWVYGPLLNACLTQGFLGGKV